MRNHSKRPVTLLLLLLSTAAAQGQEAARQQDDPPTTFSVHTQLVQIFCTVTEGARRVASLGPSDFTVLEDGRPRNIDRLDSGKVPLQIALLLDTSESMRGSMVVTQEAAVEFVNALSPGDRVSLILFNSDIRTFTQWTDDRSPIVQAIRGAQSRGGTKLHEALLFAMKHLGGKEGRKAIVCFSDGEDTARTSSMNMVLSAAARYGYPIYAVGAGNGLERGALKTVLRQIAEINSGRAFFVEEPQKLRGAFQEIATELRSAYVVNYYTDVPFDGRWHDLKVSARGPQMRVHARRGFYARAGGSASALAEATGDPRPPALDFGRAESELTEERARVAVREIQKAELPVKDIDASTLRSSLPTERAEEAAKRPVIKVESRFVEVPVLLEPSGAADPPALSQKDFRIYEDDTLQQTVFFSRDLSAENLQKLREEAMKKARETAKSEDVQGSYGDAGVQLLGRYYILLDDVMTDMSELTQAKLAAEKILREYSRPMRPFSVHLASEGGAGILQDDPPETMIRRVRNAISRAPAELTTNDRTMNVYEAYLIERGDRDAAMLAELRTASDMSFTYSNELGTVVGPTTADPDVIRTMVQSTSRNLTAENYSQVSRLLDNLESVVRAAATDPGKHPKTVLFFTTGFMLGVGTGRSELGRNLERITADARRNGVKVFTIDAEGLSPRAALSVQTRGSFLVGNPHLSGMVEAHARDWKTDCKASLDQIASDTGAKFLHNTNDLAGIAAAAIRSLGQLYYLGYISNRPADGRYHRIRVTASLASARVRAREGYVASLGGQEPAAAAAADNEDWEAVINGAEQARKAGDFKGLAGSLEKLVRRFPGQASLWFNLGVARLKTEDPQRAVEALQRAFLLAPGDKATGLTLSRALIAAGYRAAAADTVGFLLRRFPRDVELIVQAGLVYEAQALPVEAYQAYRRALDVSLELPLQVYVLLHRTASTIGRKVEAGVFMRDYLARGGDPASIGR